jgi:hypothetical protein
MFEFVIKCLDRPQLFMDKRREELQAAKRSRGAPAGTDADASSPLARRSLRSLRVLHRHRRIHFVPKQNLTVLGLKSLIKKTGRHADGGGLYFRVIGKGKAYFVFRYRLARPA